MFLLDKDLLTMEIKNLPRTGRIKLSPDTREHFFSYAEAFTSSFLLSLLRVLQ